MTTKPAKLSKKEQRLDPKRHKRRLVTIPPSVEGNLRYWGSAALLSAAENL